MEVVAFVRAHGHEACRHGETVEVARYVAVHIGELVGVEIVAGGESEIPVACGAYVARQAEVLRYFAVILHFFLVELSVAVAHRIVYAEAPRHLPRHIAFGGQLKVVAAAVAVPSAVVIVVVIIPVVVAAGRVV